MLKKELNILLNGTGVIMHNICVVGLGYVGLPLAVMLSKTYAVHGFDVNEQKIVSLQQNCDPNNEVSSSKLQQSSVKFTSDASVISACDIIIVCVPTPIDKSNKPDLTYLRSASELIGRNIKAGTTVVFESTVYPGVTEDECVPVIAHHSGLIYNQDFYAGYSPERINPGDTTHTIDKIVKVVSGSTPGVLDILCEIYGSFTQVHRAPTIRVAEAAKVIENIQRDLNISLVNELAIIFDKLNVNVYDVLEAAGTKWNFHKYTPGLVGGHCIGVDPYYLTYKAQMEGYIPEVILAGRRVNDTMHTFYAMKIVKRLIQNDVKLKGAKVALYGLTFKPNVPDFRNSRVKNLIDELESFGIHVYGVDPMLSDDIIQQNFCEPLSGEVDMSIITVKHNNMDVPNQAISLFDL